MTDKAMQQGSQSNAQAELEMLVEMASKGDKEALNKLCERIAKDVLYKVKFMLGSKEGVEDV